MCLNREILKLSQRVIRYMTLCTCNMLGGHVLSESRLSQFPLALSLDLARIDRI